MDGAITLGTGNVNGSGVATLITSALSVATHSITAAYGGGGTTYGGSISSTLSQVVNAYGSLDHFAISAISSPQTAGTPFTITAITAQDAYNNTVTSFGLDRDVWRHGGSDGHPALSLPVC